MTMSSVVLDACVLIPSYLRDTLLTTAGAGLYIPFISRCWSIPKIWKKLRAAITRSWNTKVSNSI